MELDSGNLFKQYNDCLAILERRIEWLRTTFGAVGRNSLPEEHQAAALLLLICRQRIDRAKTDDPLLTGYILEYSSSEIKLDRGNPWRLGASVERIGRKLVAPVQIVHLPRSYQKVFKLAMSRIGDVSSARVNDLYVQICNHSMRGSFSEVASQAVAEELKARLIKLALLAKFGVETVPLSLPTNWDLVGVNLFEDALYPDGLLGQCEKWLAYESPAV